MRVLNDAEIGLVSGGIFDEDNPGVPEGLAGPGTDAAAAAMGTGVTAGMVAAMSGAASPSTAFAMGLLAGATGALVKTGVTKLLNGGKGGGK